MSDASGFRGLLERLGRQFPPKLALPDLRTPQELADWQRTLRAKLVELSGQPLAVRCVESEDPGPTPPPRVELLGREELADHVREHVAIESVFGTTVPAYVLTPRDGAAGPRPAVLALHGHTPHGKDRIAGLVPAQPDSPPGDYGLAAVRAGFVVLCPDWWGWRERAEVGFDFAGQDFCNVKFVAGMMYGLPLLSLMIHDGQAALGALLARPDVDPGRVGTIGLSFGGRMSMWLAAFDQRVRFVVSAGALNCMRERSLKLTSCGAQFFPGLLQWADVEDVFALIAPRPMLILAGRSDPLLSADDVRRMKSVIERAYRAAGAPERLTVLEHDGGHFMPQPPVVRWLLERAEAGGRASG